MLIEGIGEAPFKHVAVQNVHNTSGAFIVHNFDGPAFGEPPLNPTNNGVVFFRFCDPPYNKKIEYELRYLKALHGEVRLDAVVVFGRTMAPTSEALAIAMGVNKIDPDIKILMQILGKHFDTPLDQAAEAFYDDVKEMEKVCVRTRVDARAPIENLPVCTVDRFYINNPRENLMQLLDIESDYKTNYTYKQLRMIEGAYSAAHPLIGRPKLLAENVPVTPGMDALSQFSRGVLRSSDLKL